MKYFYVLKDLAWFFIIFSVCIFTTNHLSAQEYSGDMSRLAIWNISNLPASDNNLYYNIQAMDEISPNVMGRSFKENFEDGIADNWYDDGSGTWLVIDGVYRMHGTSSDTVRWSYYDDLFDDFDYRVDVVRKEGRFYSGQGMIFRWSQKGYYLFLINADASFTLFKYFAEYNSQEILVPWTDSEYLKKGLDRINTIKVVCKGPNIGLYANNKPLLENDVIDSSPLPGGYIGLIAYDEYDEESGADPIVDFDNVVVNVATSSTP